MSRIGKLAVPVPSGVSADIDGQTVSVKGPKGTLSFTVNDACKVEKTDDGIKITPVDANDKKSRSMWGMSRTMVSNIVVGVSEGFEKKLQINGVGYRAQVQGQNLQLALGFSHDVIYPIPEGIDIKCPTPTQVTKSWSRASTSQRVGQGGFAEIRAWRPAGALQGQGCANILDEYVFRKEGKKK